VRLKRARGKVVVLWWCCGGAVVVLWWCCGDEMLALAG
jgi:hypothetical protein